MEGRPDFNNVSSAKDDRDDLFIYKNIDLKSFKRVPLFGVPIDNVTRDEAIAYIYSSIEKKKNCHVIFLDPIKLLKIRFNRCLHSIVEEADLVLAEGCGLLWAAKKNGHSLKERIPTIAVMMDIVRLAMRTDFTIYFLGSRTECLEKVFFMLRRSFPGVRIIGRKPGNFNKKEEALIKESLRKLSPNIVFLAMDFPEQELWLHENKNLLSQTVVVGVDDAFEIFSGLERKAPDWIQTRGLNWLWYVVTRPWRISRIFAFFGFYFILFYNLLPFFGKKRGVKS